jgi:hypothetical protein
MGSDKQTNKWGQTQQTQQMGSAQQMAQQINKWGQTPFVLNSGAKWGHDLHGIRQNEASAN